jgi:spermidine/putrescine transport system ATP-binding protein
MDNSHIRFLGHNFNCLDNHGHAAGTKVKVHVDFGNVILQDNEEDGMVGGVVSFILYKGNQSPDHTYGRMNTCLLTS